MTGEQHGVQSGIDAEDLRGLFADLKELSDGKARKAALVRNLKGAGQPILRQVERNAAHFSSRTGVLGLKVRSTGKAPGVLITASRRKAPGWRPIDNAGQQGTFVHPIFGRSGSAARQPAHPFFFTDLPRHWPDVEQAAADAFDEAARDAGFR